MKVIKMQNKEKYSQAVELASKGVQQKDIAVQIGITEKTVSRWLKDWKAQQSKHSKLLDELQTRLEKAIANPDTKPSEIKELAQVYNMLK